MRIDKILWSVLVFALITGLSGCTDPENTALTPAAVRTVQETVPTQTEQYLHEDAQHSPETLTEPADKETTFSTEETTLPTETTAPTEAPTEAPAETPTESSGTGIRPEFQAAMDSYEAFFADYCDLLKAYKNNPTDFSLLMKYTDMMSKSIQMQEDFDAWEEDEDLTNEELKYYLEVNTRIQKMLIDVM